jgi:hypothetical protein
VAGKGHDDAGHVLVAAGDGDAGIVVLGAGYRFYAVGDDFSGLEGEAHSWDDHGQIIDICMGSRESEVSPSCAADKDTAELSSPEFDAGIWDRFR